jgi:hypothetical protein
MKHSTGAFSMTSLNAVRFTPVLAAALVLFSSFLWAAEVIISRVPDSSGNYCHLKFPAIRPETPSWPKPELKDASEGDIIDFYGPCDHDPLGKVEIHRQKQDYRRQFSRPAD